MQTDPPPDLLTMKEAAHILRLSRQSLCRQRRLKTGPPYIKLPTGAIRYSREELLAWIRSGKAEVW